MWVLVSTFYQFTQSIHPTNPFIQFIHPIHSTNSFIQFIQPTRRIIQVFSLNDSSCFASKRSPLRARPSILSHDRVTSILSMPSTHALNAIPSVHAFNAIPSIHTPNSHPQFFPSIHTLESFLEILVLASAVLPAGSRGAPWG